MDIVKYIGYYLISVFSLEVLILAYDKINGYKAKRDLKFYIVLLLCSLFVTINFYNNYPANKILVNILVMYTTLVLISKENLFKIFAIYIIMYLILFISEIITSAIVMIANIANMNAYNSNIIIKALVTLFSSGIFYYICSRKNIIKFINKVTSRIKANYLLILVVILSLIVFIITDIRFFNTFSSKIYFSNFIILGCLLIIIVLTIKAYITVYKEKQKMEVLLNFMTKYERIIDQDRIYKHELLNELLTLKNINKKSKEFNEILDSLIDKYTNKGIKIKNVYKLPHGLKGILYYKLYGLEENGYDLKINVSNKTINKLKNIENNDYIALYKVVGIVIDNAIEASSKTKNKYILVDIYDEDNIVVEISNSFKGKVDLEMINKKNYSTKGKRRGLGLYIMSNITKNSNIKIDRSINNNIFTTKITINKK